MLLPQYEYVAADKKFHVVVVGAGFGGLTFCKQFKMDDARITLVDRTNHHLFQPLLYQVATSGLSRRTSPNPSAPSSRNARTSLCC
ncbi:MAG: FAD-dependent oxidoreductase [Limisphaerales bacterium]